VLAGILRDAIEVRIDRRVHARVLARERRVQRDLTDCASERGARAMSARACLPDRRHRRAEGGG
jgi:hypothetical protein